MIYMKHRAVVIILCILAPVIYLVCAFATNSIIPVDNREMPQPASLIEQKEFEALRDDVVKKMAEPTPETEPLPTYEELPDITIDKPSNVDQYKNDIDKKSKEISENVAKTIASINDRIESWELPDPEENLPEQKSISIPSSPSLKEESMPDLPSFAEIAAMLPNFKLPDLVEEIQKIQNIEIPTISIPEIEIPTLPPLQELEVPELPDIQPLEIPEIFKQNN